jgi:adenylate cyclase
MEIQKLLRGAEIDAEKVSAVIRLVVFVTLASVIFSADGAQAPATATELAIGIYGVGTIVGLVLAWRGVFHPIIPYLFVTFDVILVSAQILILTGLMGMNSSFAFALPATSLIFVILIHASMRYRPWLIVYAASLFLVVLNLGNLFLTPDHAAITGMRGMRQEGAGSFMNYQVLPFMLVALAAFILFVTSRWTRALLLKSITQTNRAAKLSRYFSPNLANSLAESDDDQLLAGRRLSAAVLFVDIRGFTALGETLTPEELTSFLSEYRNRLTKPIFAHGGMVDKFIGDAIMAVFGTPAQRPDDASRAVTCALEILDATKHWSEDRVRSGNPPVAIGIGVHYGEVFAGALGNEQLLEYTVIGDTVNVAERLEGLSRNVGSPLVVSAALLEAAADTRERVAWRRLPPQELKGHRKPVEAFCLAALPTTPSSSGMISAQ